MAQSTLQRGKNSLFGAAWLRIAALLFMLLDHLWASVVPGGMWMHYLGRVAMPIFAFQAAEGLFYTHDAARYKKRLLLFAVLSEIPFDLFVSGGVFFSFHQNVLFTLLLGVCGAQQLALLEKAAHAKARLRHAAALCGYLLLSVLLLPDYGWRGAVLVMLFYAARGFAAARLMQLLGMLVLFVVTFEGQMLLFEVAGGTLSFPVQGFSLLALPLIWCCGGEKGAMPKWLRAASYLFYPLHMLLLWAVMRFAA
ncbi:MAG: conjugal transfer protein TraX [Oscillospiraceae bacterium]|nr:conjugal transfer protein TraX [Oscillospiraceae bacterium]